MRSLAVAACVFIMSGCTTLAFQEQTNCIDLLICPEGPKIVPSSAHQLLNLPAPNTQAVVAVYEFPDATGQRKSKDNVASFSTAVTQGGLDILTEALRDAGRGSWFVVVERAGLDNLSRERQLIVNTRKTYDGEEGNTLKPLLYAGMILEGGIVAYDSNIRTGGVGAMFLYLVQTGEVLLNVTTTKNILSTGVGSDLFRFYEMGTELVEVESGNTKNEAVSYAVRAAIEAAVYGLVVEGLEKQLWDFNYDTLNVEDEDEMVKKDTD